MTRLSLIIGFFGALYILLWLGGLFIPDLETSPSLFKGLVLVGMSNLLWKGV